MALIVLWKQNINFEVINYGNQSLSNNKGWKQNLRLEIPWPEDSLWHVIGDFLGPIFYEVTIYQSNNYYYLW